ncbi:immunoglobulin lambda-1 light chain-like isoform X4 [Anolis carolinensis]|uniref:immunoglobulin lambda-1 light chain-like isoform X4 n=1 Tax=Anolis carolinensis TaxID=28377 RepID=UPI002F2B2F37
MARVLLFLVLLNYYAGVHSQGTLTQPSSVSGSPGQTVTLSCTKDSGNWYSYASWYQQKSGEGPRFVHCNGCSRGPGIPDRFTATKSGDTGTLTITNVQAEDEAYYYCAWWYSTGSSFVFGGGTHMTVTGQPVAHPVVSLFPPSQEELKSKNKATLACLMDGFHPGVVQVEWLGDGRTISSGVETTKPVKQGDKYIASSYLTLSRSEWEANESYTCKVTHESKTIEKVVSRSACS